MIEELVDYINYLRKEKPEAFKLNLNPSEGLHVFVEIDPETRKRISPLLIEEIGNDTETQKIPATKIAQYEQHLALVTMNKAVDSKKQIHSGNPLALKIRADKDLNKVRESVSGYFENAISLMVNEDDPHELQQAAHAFAKYAENEFWDDFNSHIKERFDDLAQKKYLFVYANTKSFEPEIFEKLNGRYLSTKLFNSDKFNQKDDSGQTFGVSDYLNGLNSKKPFLRHYSALFEAPGIVSESDNQAIFQFQQLQKRDIFCNPMPIFIDQEELNGEVISIVKQSGKRVSYREVFKKLFSDQSTSKDIGNYYLLYWLYGELKDIDFVSNYDHRLEQLTGKRWYIQPIVSYKSDDQPHEIKTLFDIEKFIVSPLYNNGLVVTSTKDGMKVLHFSRYFEDLEMKNFGSNRILQKAIEHRKAWFDFIYKGRLQAISPQIFKQICLTAVFDKLHEALRAEDETYIPFEIRLILNIYFSFNALFDPQNRNFNGKDMTHELPETIKNIQHFLQSDEDAMIENDLEFGFLAGQVIRYLLHQSQSGDKRNGLFDPFVKTSNPQRLKQRIQQSIEQYQYNIYMGYKALGKSISAVLMFDTKNSDFELIKTAMIAGYYHNNYLLAVKKEKETNS
jgi:CRISPR-associated protein Csh1